MEKYRGDRTWCDYHPDAFNQMIAELVQLNVKYLQQLLNDLKSGYIPPWSGDYHRILQSSLEISILERTVLK